MKYATTSIAVYGSSEDPTADVDFNTINAKLDTEIQTRELADTSMSYTISYVANEIIPFDETTYVTNITASVDLSLGTVVEDGVRKIVLLRNGIAGSKL